MRSPLFALALALAPGALGCGASTAASNEAAAPAATTAPASAKTSLEVVAELTEAPGNITLTPEGRIVISLHPFYEPVQRVVEVMKGGELKPFPNAAWNRAEGPPEGRLDAVLGIQSDRDGIVWMLDTGMRSGATPKLVGWDSRKDALVRVVPLPPPIAPKDAFVNDLAVDRTNESIYIADPAGGANAALIVIDLKTGAARRVLQGHESVLPKNDLDLMIDGRPVQIRRPDGALERPHLGVNPIALDGADAWLYFGPMHGTRIYRVRTSDLRDAKLDAVALAARVERYADRPICDGISMDRGGNIYISDLEANAVGVIGADRSYRRLVSDPRLSWLDAFSFGPDNKLYAVTNQLHRTARLNAGERTAKPPFFILKLTPLADGVVGR